MKREPSRFATIGSRIIVSSSLLSCFAALTWADATGFLGGLPGWWLLPILILLAVGGVNEFLGLYAKRRIQLKGGLLRIGVVAIFLAVAVGTQAMVSDTGDTAPVAALSWSALAATVAIGLLFVQEILLTRTSSQSLDRLAAGVFVLTYLGFPMAFMVGLRLVNLASLGFEQTTPKYFEISIETDKNNHGAKIFTICVKNEKGVILGIGKGSSKKEGEQDASNNALKFARNNTWDNYVNKLDDLILEFKENKLQNF